MIKIGQEKKAMKKGRKMTKVIKRKTATKQFTMLKYK